MTALATGAVGVAEVATVLPIAVVPERVRCIELIGTPTWAVINIIRRHERLPIELFGD